MVVNTMNPDQTAPKGAVWSVSILFEIYATYKNISIKTADEKSRDWRERVNVKWKAQETFHMDKKSK